MNNLYNQLESIHACREALDWVEENNFKHLLIAWKRCHRPDWMLWLAGKMEGKEGWPTRRELVLTACDCAETAMKYVPEGEDRPRKAIEAARMWADGKATIKQVRDAALAAYAAATAYAAYADATFAVYAAHAASVAAAYAAHAASVAAAYAGAASVAAYAYAAAYAAHAYGADRAKALKEMATVIRRRLKPGNM